MKTRRRYFVIEGGKAVEVTDKEPCQNHSVLFFLTAPDKRTYCSIGQWYYIDEPICDGFCTGTDEGKPMPNSFISKDNAPIGYGRPVRLVWADEEEK